VLHSRGWSKISQIPASKLINSPYQLNAKELDTLASTLEHVSRKNLMICDDATVTTDDILLKSMEAEQKMGGLDVIGLDYIQLASLPPWLRKKSQNRTEEVSEISRQLKRNVIRRLNVPMVALSQLHRLREESTVPTMADMRDSGQLEQDADVAILLHRRRINDKRDSNAPDDFDHEAWVGKNKNGPTGYIPLLYRKQTMKFEEKYDPNLPL